MPDQAAVELALAGFISGAVYPGGVGAVSAIGTTCRVYRGWPVVGALEEDLVAGIAHVTVRPVNGSARTTTRYPREWAGAAPSCPLEVATVGTQVVFSGVAGPGMVAGVRVDGRAYAYRVTGASTPGVVAAVLASMVRVDRPAALVDATVEFADGVGVLGRAVSDGQGGEELRRQTMVFRVGLWCPSPEVRDEVSAFVDLALAGVGFLDVEGWGCRVVSVAGGSDDDGAAVRSWRRDLLYRVEYPTTTAEALPSLLFGGVGALGGEYFG